MERKTFDTGRKTAHVVMREQFIYAIDLMDKIQHRMQATLLDSAEHSNDWRYFDNMSAVLAKLEDILEIK
jgi:hypothetical protein